MACDSYRISKATEAVLGTNAATLEAATRTHGVCVACTYRRLIQVAAVNLALGTGATPEEVVLEAVRDLGDWADVREHMLDEWARWTEHHEMP